MTIPTLTKIKSKCVILDLDSEKFRLCDECNESFEVDELRGNLREGFFCTDCYVPDEFDNAEHNRQRRIDDERESRL